MKSGKPDPGSGPSDSPDDSREKWITIDRLCDAYEASLQEGTVERAPFLAGVPADWREQLTRELDAIDAAYRDAEETREQTLKADADEPCSRRLPTQSRLAELATLDSNKVWLGRFEIRKRLGTGATGSVWCARDARLARWVALKVPHVSRVMSETTAARFQTEARAAAAISHPNVVQVHEVLIEDGLPILIQQWIDGPSLAAHLKNNGPMEFDTAAEWMAQIADAVACAHGKGIVHRDLKPANVMLAADRPMVLDFGLASYPQLSSGLTSEGAVLGTPAYMSPEQAAGADNANQPASDLYALGAMLYEMLVGAPPFVGKAREVLDAAQRTLPTPPRSRRPRVPRDLETITLRCLAKNPAARYHGAAELRDDLRRFLRREPIRARKVSKLETGLAWCRLHPAKATAAIALPLVLFLVIAVVASQLRQQRLYREKLAGESAQQQSRAQRHMVQLARASHELSEGDRTRGLELLRSVPEDLRGWEWRLLDLVSHSPSQRLNQRLPEGVSNRTPVTALAIARTSRKLFSAARDGTVLQWTLPSERELFPKNRKAAVHIDVPTSLIRTAEPIQAMAVSPNERWLAWVDQQVGVFCWDLRENELAQHIRHPGLRRGYAIAFSPDSTRLLVGGGGVATANFPADSRSWLVGLEMNEAGEFVQSAMLRTNHRIAITSLAWISNETFVCTRGQILSSSSSIGFVEQWKWTPKRFAFQQQLCRGLAMRGLDHHPATGQIAWCDVAGICYVRELVGEMPPRQFQVHRRESLQVRFAPAGDEVVVVGDDGCVSLWFVGKPPRVAEPETTPEQANSEVVAAETPQGADEANGAERSTAERATANRKPQPAAMPVVRHLRDYHGHENAVGSAVFLAPQPATVRRANHLRDYPARLITAGADGSVMHWDLCAPPQIDSLSVAGHRVVDAGWTADRQLSVAAVASSKRRDATHQESELAKHGITLDIRRIPLAQSITRPPARSQHDDSPARRDGSSAIPVAANKPRYAIQGRGFVFVFQAGQTDAIRVCKIPDLPRAAFTAACLVDPDHLIAAVSRVVSEVDDPQTPQVEVGQRRESILYHYDLRSDAPPKSISLPDIPAVTTLKCSPDGRQLVGGTNRGELFVMPVAADRLDQPAALSGHHHRWKAHRRGRINDLEWIGDDGTLATVGDDGTCVLWNPVVAAATPTDRRVASKSTGSREGLTATHYRSGHRLFVSSGPVTRLHVSSDGDRIVTASEDRVIRIWDTTSGLELIRLEQRKQPIASVAFSPDDRFLMVADAGGRIEAIRLEY